MSLIDQDKSILFNLACKYHSNFDPKKHFKEIDKNTESYFLKPRIDESEYLQEYEFDTPMELQKKLEKLILEDEFPKEFVIPVSVIALKLKDHNSKKDTLMETIYNF